MSRKVRLPSESDVAAKVRELQDGDAGRSPTVVAVARELGLSNGTFWRYFPAVAQSIADARRAEPKAQNMPRNRVADDHERSARLERRVRDLETQLEQAVQRIRELSLHNHQLLAELEHPGSVIRGVFGKPVPPAEF